ncbi:cache domain-containing sensor histidine kinase [Paenibacillus aceris]|uniref:Two-component system sensor histidine kinase YesM n=1 Tax=Paenibacillus aceris TaxID=869555 RepID=A0ABS4HSL4_9BACL|nr:sensor histidine kinase [Paenibacillus aceris]MBP1961604.1 two-component system sensor histidine kinase YesM [Paenibacillus aceris]NHW37623.1 sensor histidine kinase [Paenibacillus aceris]
MLKWKQLTRQVRMKHVNHQIFMLMILIITIPLLIISVIIYLFSIQAVKNEYQSSSNLILTNLSFNIDQYLQSIEKGTLNAQMDGQLQGALEQWTLADEDSGNDQMIVYGNIIEHFISSIEMTIKNVDSVQIYSGSRMFYSSNFNRSDYDVKDFTHEDWYTQTQQKAGGIVLFGAHLPFHRVNAKESVISIARVINKVGSKQPIGVMLIDIRLDSLREILKLSENRKRSFLIIDDKGGIIYNSDRSQAMTHLSATLKEQAIQSVLADESGSFYANFSGVDSYINFVTSSYSGWKVIQYIDEKEMTKQADILIKIVLTLAFLSLGTALLFMFILSARVTKPIILLSRQVKLVGLGKFDVDLSSDRQDEFGVLYQGIRKMVEDLQSYIERSATAKVQQKIAQFGALKSQINPHFLANVLESIQMKAVINGQRDISEMVGMIGRLFRIHIQTGKETVTLREELEHIRLYVKIQQLRFGDKIQYTERLAEDSTELQVIHFSLQPLIENAIVHGLERLNGPGLLEVSTVKSGNDMLIMIKDNGVGMDEEKLQHLQLRLAQSSNTLDEAHIGIKNVHDRICFYFGEQYGLTLYSQLGEGTTVIIRLPMK